MYSFSNKGIEDPVEYVFKPLNTEDMRIEIFKTQTLKLKFEFLGLITTNEFSLSYEKADETYVIVALS